jgi:SSS family solute:Na+ symporter
MSPTQHIWALRAAVVGVAVWAFCFSMFVPQTQFIVLWWAITGAIFTGGAGAAIIGGLYWRKGTAAGAWAGAITGSTLCVTGIICSSFWPTVSGAIQPVVAPFGVALPPRFWFNGAVASFIAICTAATVYVVISLLTCREAFNLDKMLHRGIYAVEPGHGRPITRTWRERLHWRRLVNFDTNFSKTDKLMAGGIFWWSMLLVGVNLVACVWNLAYEPWPVAWWAHYWMITGIALPCVIAVGTLVWFGIGGVRDIRDFFVALRTLNRDAHDDGRVHEDPAKARGFAVEAPPPPPAPVTPTAAVPPASPVVAPRP